MAGDGAGKPRVFSVEEVEKHNADGASFWAVVDGFVVDATEFVGSHPGGVSKLLSANTSGAGHTGAPFGFSFARGPNAHFAATAQRFRDGVAQYLGGCGDPESCLPPANVVFPSHGTLIILGHLS